MCKLQRRMAAQMVSHMYCPSISALSSVRCFVCISRAMYSFVMVCAFVCVCACVGVMCACVALCGALCLPAVIAAAAKNKTLYDAIGSFGIHTHVLAPNDEINKWNGAKMYFNTENDIVDGAAPQSNARRKEH